MVNMRARYVSLGVLAAVCALAGCSAPGVGIAQAMKPGVPEGLIIEPLNEGPATTWIKPGETFAIVTLGSGSCPPVATALAADGPDHIAVTFGSSPNDPCTADIAPTTYEFELPDEISRLPVIIEVSYEDWPGTDTLTLK